MRFGFLPDRIFFGVVKAAFCSGFSGKMVFSVWFFVVKLW
jgi:hypothetical protein